MRTTTLVLHPSPLTYACVSRSPEMNSPARILLEWGWSFHPVFVLAFCLLTSSYWGTRCCQFLNLLRILQHNLDCFSAFPITFLWFGFLRSTRWVAASPFAFQLAKFWVFSPFFSDFPHSCGFYPFKNTITVVLLEFWMKVKLNTYVHSVIWTSSAKCITPFNFHFLDY